VGTGFPLANKRGTRLRGDHAQINEIESDDDSKKRHHSLCEAVTSDWPADVRPGCVSRTQAGDQVRLPAHLFLMAGPARASNSENALGRGSPTYNRPRITFLVHASAVVLAE